MTGVSVRQDVTVRAALLETNVCSLHKLYKSLKVSVIIKFSFLIATTIAKIFF